MRYIQYESTPHGNWLAGAVHDEPYTNVTLPVAVHEMRQRLGDFWRVPYREILLHLLQRFVVRLHLSLAYEKSGSFFYLDEDRIRGRGKRYDEPAYSNGRFSSGPQILYDLGLLSEDTAGANKPQRTAKGTEILSEELKKGALT